MEGAHAGGSLSDMKKEKIKYNALLLLVHCHRLEGGEICMEREVREDGGRKGRVTAKQNQLETCGFD